MRAGNALLPADLLVQFGPWRSAVGAVPHASWDPLVWDGIAQYYPWRLFAAESLRAGVIPLWNPYQFCGTPFVANGQSAVFYPLNAVFWLMPVGRAFGWSAWLHLALTGWFAYLFLRRVGADRVGSVAGAVVWQGNGFFVAWMHLPTVLCTAGWLPLALLCVERALAQGRARWAVGAGAALGMAGLAGHPQMLQLVVLMTGAYALVRGLAPSLRVGVGARLARLAATGVVAVGVAGGLAAVQLLPTLDLLRIAHRTFTPGPESYRAYLSHAMPSAQLAGMLLPHAFGHPALGSYVGQDNYAEFAAYVGIVGLALALWGALSCRTWHARFFALSVLVVFLIALGTSVNGPLYRWVPGMARSGGPGRMLLLGMFGLSVMVGSGVSELGRRLGEKKGGAWAGFALLLAALFAGTWVWRLLVTPELTELRPGIAALSAGETRRAGALCLAAVLAMGTAWRWSRPKLGMSVLIAVLAVDLLLAANGHLHVSPMGSVYPAFPLSEPEQGRVVGNAKDWPSNRFPNAVLPPNAATVYRLRDVFGYDSLYLASYRDFAAAVQHGDPSPPLNGNLLLARLGQVYGLDVLSLAGVETVLSPTPVRGLKLELAGAYYVYSNPYALPRAWVAGSAVFVPSHQEAVVALAELGPMPDCVLITGKEDMGGVTPSGARAAAEVKDLSVNAVEVKLSGRGGGYLFLADAYAPGWRAYADGREVAIRPADVAFRAVALPREARAVVFRYEPAAFRVGLFAALATCLLVSAVIGSRITGRGQ